MTVEIHPDSAGRLLLDELIAEDFQRVTVQRINYNIQELASLNALDSRRYCLPIFIVRYFIKIYPNLKYSL